MTPAALITVAKMDSAAHHAALVHGERAICVGTLRDRRRALDLSSRRLAVLAGLDTSFYWRVENGKVWSLAAVLRAHNALTVLESDAGAA